MRIGLKELNTLISNFLPCQTLMAKNITIKRQFITWLDTETYYQSAQWVAKLNMGHSEKTLHHLYTVLHTESEIKKHLKNSYSNGEFTQLWYLWSHFSMPTWPFLATTSYIFQAIAFFDQPCRACAGK